MVAGDRPVQNLCALLAQKQLPTGGWAALSRSSQAALEPTALACLALGREFSSFRDRATHFLLRIQNPNGSWPAFEGDDLKRGRGLPLLCSSLYMMKFKLSLSD